MNKVWTRILVAGAFALSVLVVGCSDKAQFTSNSNTIYFTQGYNPPYLDVLWMVDSRSPMHNDQSQLTSEAQAFFTRLDSSTTQYRMAMVSADMQYARGALQPQSNPIILTKGLGTLDQRVANFSSLISQEINLNTSASNAGFQSALAALQGPFVPKKNVPLVLVFVGYSDDHSALPNGATDLVTYYSQAYLVLKGNDTSLLRGYSVNYTAGGKRCAQQYGSDIDSAGFTNNYFNMATALSGSTGDLCGSWSSNVDLTGLRLSDLPKSFALEQVPANPSGMQVTVSQNGTQITNLTWTYDATNNAIVFNAAPPEGSTIAVTFQ